MTHALSGRVWMEAPQMDDSSAAVLILFIYILLRGGYRAVGHV
jgi:hypothetical protein